MSSLKSIFEGNERDGNCDIVNCSRGMEVVEAWRDEIDGSASMACKEASKVCNWRIWFGYRIVVVVLIPDKRMEGKDWLSVFCP